MAIGTTAAILGASAIGAGASIISGNKAAKAQRQAADQAAETERYIYDTTREDYAPYRAVGYGALGKLAGLYGIDVPQGSAGSDWGAYLSENPDVLKEYQSGRVSQAQFPSAQDYAKWHYQTYGQGEGRQVPSQFTQQAGSSGGMDDFFKSPDYQFRLDEARKAVERSASARGRLNSPATQLRVAEVIGNQASSEYNNYANRLAAMAGIGQSATGAVAQAGQQYASGTGQAVMAAGNARASSYANTGAAINQGIGNLASAYLYNKGWGQGTGGTYNTPPVYGGNLDGVY